MEVPVLPPYPFSVDFQRAVIGSAIVNRTFLARHARFIRSVYFTAPPLRELCALLTGFYETHRAAPSREAFLDLVGDAIKVRALKPAVASAMTDAMHAALAVEASDVPYVADKLFDWARTETIALTAMHIASLYEKSKKTGKAETDALMKLFDDTRTALSVRSSSGLDYFGDVVQRVYSDHNTMRVPTGYATLDEKLEGGVDRGELLVFLGGPTMGKTAFLVGAARGALLHRHRVLVVTNEVSPRRWASRVDRAVTGKTRAEILASPREAIHVITRLRQVRGRMIIKGYPSGTATVDDIAAYMDELSATENFVPDALIVDYADELQSARYDGDYRLGVIDVYRKLRALGQMHDIPVLTASQAGKQAEGKVIVNMRDAAEAYAKNAVADIVIALCQTEEEAAAQPYPLCRLYGAKNREGERRFILPYIFRAERGVIIPAGQYALPMEDTVAYGTNGHGAAV